MGLSRETERTKARSPIWPALTLLTRSANDGSKRALEGDEEWEALLLREGERRVDLAQPPAEWFLGEHGLSRVEARLDVLVVRVGRRGDDDRVDVRRLDRVGRARRDARVFGAGDAASALEIRVEDAGERRVSHRAETRDVESTGAAESEKAESSCRHVGLSKLQVF